VALRAFITLPPIRPIVPVPCDEPFDHPDWLFEPKYDGVRGLLHVTSRECCFLSKGGAVLARFQELGYWVREELPVKEAILDGEIVALDSGGRQSFRELAAGGGHLHYAAFDALWLGGRDLRGLPLDGRKPGSAPPMTEQNMADLLCFLDTLNDDYKPPATPPKSGPCVN